MDSARQPSRCLLLERDPMSGLVPLLEQARASRRCATRPAGAETHCDLLRLGRRRTRTSARRNGANSMPGNSAKKPLLINTDTNARGFLGLSGSHARKTFAAWVAREISIRKPASMSRNGCALLAGQRTPSRSNWRKADLYRALLDQGRLHFLAALARFLSTRDFAEKGRGDNSRVLTLRSLHTLHRFRFLTPRAGQSSAIDAGCRRRSLPFDFRASQTYSRYDT